MLGAIIGDTVGSIYEFNNIHTTDFPLFSKSSTFTDDSIMSMAVAKWLLTDEHHTQSSLIEIMEKFYGDYPDPMGGYGNRFGVWLATPTAQKKPYNSFGNGSAMRASACGWVAKSKDEAMRLAKISAEVTHNHPEGIKGAQAVAVGVYMMRHGALKCDVADFLKDELGYTFDEDLKSLQSIYSFDETCQGTISAAFTAFGESATFEEAIRNAISIGGDSDTVACIAGAFAEAFYKVIPADIVHEMEKRLPSDWWHIIYRVKAYENHQVAPDHIDFLKSEQIFVFGSNKEGQHYGGAAAYAHKYFHAKWGVGEGITGLCYALPTMEGLEDLELAVGRFTEHALADPDHNYLVTAVGCGIAGYTPEEVAPMFLEAAALPNVYLPQCFWDELDKYHKSSIAIMKKFIQTKLQELLNSLDTGFDTNELAYLSSQGKNELQIRDKIAWRLHKVLNAKYGDDNLFVVRREWAPESCGRERVDLAILEMDSARTTVVRAIALIEFKAQSIARPEKWYIDEYVHDVEKMRKLKEVSAECKDADMYFVFLETGQECKADKYKSVLGYAIYQNGKMAYHEDADYLSSVKSHWDEFRDALGELVTIHEPKAIYIGESFGYKQYVSPLLIGPLK